MVNAPSKQLEPLMACVQKEFQPKCNFSKVFSNFDQDEHFIPEYSTNICNDVPCDWDQDCQKGMFCTLKNYQYPPVCADYTQGCDPQPLIVTGKNYSNGTLTYVNSTNRCYNVACLSPGDCAGDLPCWNASFCGGPDCNSTQVYDYFDDAS